MEFEIEGNRALLAKLLEVKEQIDLIRSEPPPPPTQWYPYTSVHTSFSMLAWFDKHGRDFADLIQGKSCVDIGCANAEVSFWLERAGAGRVTATDTMLIAPYWDVVVRMIRNKLGSQIGIIDADVTDWRPPEHYDVAFCLGLLYHATAPQTILERLVTLCDTLVLGTKVWRHDDPVQWVYNTQECNGDVTNWFCPTPTALRRMVERAGFRVEMMDVHGGTGDPIDMSQDARILVLATALPPKFCTLCGRMFREEGYTLCAYDQPRLGASPTMPGRDGPASPDLAAEFESVPSAT